MEIEIDVHGNEKQLICINEWINNDVNDIVYGGSKGSAKSYTGCLLICGDALLYPNTHYFIARKKLSDLTKYTLPSIYEVLDHYKVDQSYFNYNAQSSVIKFKNGSKIYLIEAKYYPSDPMYARLGSMQMTRGWIEEAGEFDVEAKNNLLATVGRWNNDVYGINGKILQTCNPSKNYLYKDYYKKFHENSLEPFKRFIQALPSDNKKIQKGYVEMLHKTLSKNERERLLFGNWEYDDDPTILCDYDNIISIFGNDHIKGSERFITGDIARLGSDKAILLVWEGWVIIDLVVFEKSLLTEIQNVINSLRVKYQISKRNVVVDEDGVGAGVVDNSGVEGFVNNSKALNDENYYNLQSQCCYGLADQINTKQIYFKADLSEKYKNEIIEELEQLKSFNADQDGKLRILPKIQIKQNIGRSPDWRDVLMMRKYFDLKPKNRAPRSRLI